MNPITEALRKVDEGCETCDGEMRIHYPPWSSGTTTCPSSLHAAARELVEACAALADSFAPPPDGGVDTGRMWRGVTAKNISAAIRAALLEETNS